MPPTNDGRSPLHAEIEFLLRQDHARLMNKTLRPWRGFISHKPVRCTKFDGSKINTGGKLGFSGSIREIYWFEYMQPYLQDFVTRDVRAVVTLADEHGLDRQQALQSASGFLRMLNRSTFRQMRKDDRLFRLAGQVKDDWQPPHEELLAAGMNEFVDSAIASWLEHRAEPITTTGVGSSKPMPEIGPIRGGAASATPDGSTRSRAITCAPDGTWLVVRGKRFNFSKGNQARAALALFQSWEDSGRIDGCGLSEEEIGERVGSESFRMSPTFRSHAAFGTIIRRQGKGVFALWLNDPPPETFTRSRKKHR